MTRDGAYLTAQTVSAKHSNRQHVIYKRSDRAWEVCGEEQLAEYLRQGFIWCGGYHKGAFTG